MKRTLAARLLAIMLAGMPAAVAAQSSGSGTSTTATNPQSTGTFVVRLLEVDGRAYNSMRRDNDLGQAACSKMVPLKFRLEGMPSGFNSPEYIWVVIGGSCNSSERRDGIGEDDCEQIAVFDKEPEEIQKEVTIPLNEQFCDITGNPQLYFLLTNTVGTAETISSYATIAIRLDTSPPGPPTNIRGGRGETAIPVEWDAASGSPTNYYVIYEPQSGGAEDSGPPSMTAGDEDAGSEADCTSTRLVPGQAFDVDTPMDGVYVDETGDNGKSYRLSGAQIGAPRAAVAVISEDLAGNRSVLSSLACVDVVPTDGFWDDYKREGGRAEPGCACSVPSASRSPVYGLPLALALLALCLRRNRRRS
jgi:MYXO-CTERM domain-containing protein